MKNTEKAFLAEEEKKREKSKEDAKKQKKRVLQTEKVKKVVHEEEETSNNLQRLKDLFEEHIVDDALVEKVIQGTEIDYEDIQEIFEKIDEIEELDGIDDYLPKEMRITKQEYADATHDDAMRDIVIGKLETSLTLLSEYATPQLGGSVNVLGGFLAMLDKNLITIQDHHIDMKDSLTSDDAKNSQSIWEVIQSAFKKG